MDYFYFDASALAKRYADEAGTEVVNGIFDTASPTQMMCLIIGATEVVSALVRKRNDSQQPMPQAVFLQALVNLQDEVINSLDFRKLPALNRLVTGSIGLIMRHSINSTDAIVLISALEISDELQQQGGRLTVVSSDQRLLRAATAEGLKVLNPEVAGAL